MIKVVAVAEVGDNFSSRSPTWAAGCFEFCRGRRSRRQNSVAVADFSLNRGCPGYAVEPRDFFNIRVVGGPTFFGLQITS